MKMNSVSEMMKSVSEMKKKIACCVEKSSVRVMTKRMRQRNEN